MASEQACPGFLGQRFKPLACKHCYRHKDSHAVVHPLADPQDEEKRQARIREFTKNVGGPAVLNRFESLLIHERAKQNEAEEAREMLRRQHSAGSYGSSPEVGDDEGKQQPPSVREKMKGLMVKTTVPPAARPTLSLDAIRSESEAIEARLQETLKAKEESAPSPSKSKPTMPKNLSKEDEEAAAARIAKGMPRSLAFATSRPERKKLSHLLSRGKWAIFTTHGGAQIGRWDGCCGHWLEDSFCLKYDAFLEPGDDEVRIKERADHKIHLTAASTRIRRGQPEHIANGSTLTERQHRSHQGGPCPGIDESGRHVDGSPPCKGVYTVMDVSGQAKWSCCSSTKQNFWCMNYNGPHL